MPSSLELSVYRTLAYFAYFKYPLTSFEIWKWLLEPGEEVSLAQVIEALSSSSWLKDRLKFYQGFYALEHVAHQYHDRHLRFLDAMRKYDKALRTAKWLGRLPWIEGVAICNSLAWQHTNTKSDIDLFIIATSGRLWSARLLSTWPLKFLRERPGEGNIDPICLSFFCTPSVFNFESLKIGSADPYLAYWCSSLIPVVDRGNWQAKFGLANRWLAEVLPNVQNVQVASQFRVSIMFRLPRLPISEALPKQLQLDRFPSSIRSLMNIDSRVVVTDDMLKFHEQDAREQIRTALENRMTSL